MKKADYVKGCFLAAIALALFASGCATTKASYNALNPPKDEQKIAQYKTVMVELTCNNEVTITQSDRERILAMVVKNIPEEAPGRFSAINPESPGESVLRAVVNITRYDEGNAFARAMLAGLGQMHIDANVSLSDFETKEALATYEVNKTFAWGGIYGGATRIQDLHDGFAKGIAAAIAGKREDSGGK